MLHDFLILPYEMQDLVKQYLAPETIVFTNKTNYYAYHYVVRSKLIPTLQIEKYIRDMVSRDLDFVFLTLCRENHERWLNMKGYRYMNQLFANYFYFLRSFCVENDALHCLTALKNALKERGVTLQLPPPLKKAKYQHVRNV